MRYRPTKFSIEEQQDIRERYSEWLKPENIVWVEKEYRDNIKYYEYQEIEKFIDKYFKFAKSYAEKMWVLEKIKDWNSHTSPYIESRIGDYKINDFNDETVQRILL